MAYLLRADGVDDSADFTEVQRTDPEWTVEYRFADPVTTENDGIRSVLSRTQNLRARLGHNWTAFVDELVYRVNATSYDFTWDRGAGDAVISDNQPHVIRVVQDATTLRAYLDDEEADNFFTVNEIFDEFNTFFRGTVELDLYYLRYWTDSTKTNLLYDWNADSSQSNGTGSILYDDASGNNATLVNFPNDDSQWVFYADEGGGVACDVKDITYSIDQLVALLSLSSSSKDIHKEDSTSSYTTGIQTHQKDFSFENNYTGSSINISGRKNHISIQKSAEVYNGLVTSSVDDKTIQNTSSLSGVKNSASLRDYGIDRQKINASLQVVLNADTADYGLQFDTADAQVINLVTVSNTDVSYQKDNVIPSGLLQVSTKDTQTNREQSNATLELKSTSQNNDVGFIRDASTVESLLLSSIKDFSYSHQQEDNLNKVIAASTDKDLTQDQSLVFYNLVEGIGVGKVSVSFYGESSVSINPLTQIKLNIK